MRVCTNTHEQYAVRVCVCNGSVADRHRSVQNVLSRLGQWARRRGVRFSERKSGAVWFYRAGSRATRDALEQVKALPTFHIPYTNTEGVAVPRVDAYLYLGVWLDERLSSARMATYMRQRLVLRTIPQESDS